MVISARSSASETPHTATKSRDHGETLMSRGVPNPTALKRDVRVVDFADDVHRAVGLLQIGCRPTVVREEVPSLSHNTIIKLCYEVIGSFPPKGALPYSELWFTHYQRSVEAAEFVTIRNRHVNFRDAYVAYLHAHDGAVLLDTTRAWTLLRMVASGVMTLYRCCRCSRDYPQPTGVLNFECCICNPPTRIKNHAFIQKHRKAR